MTRGIPRPVLWPSRLAEWMRDRLRPVLAHSTAADAMLLRTIAERWDLPGAPRCVVEIQVDETAIRRTVPELLRLAALAMEASRL